MIEEREERQFQSYTVFMGNLSPLVCKHHVGHLPNGEVAGQRCREFASSTLSPRSMSTEPFFLTVLCFVTCFSLIPVLL